MHHEEQRSPSSRGLNWSCVAVVDEPHQVHDSAFVRLTFARDSATRLLMFVRETVLICQAIQAVLVFAIVSTLTYSVTWCVRRCAPSSPNGLGDKNPAKKRVGGEGKGDSHDEADDAPLCKASHLVSHHPPERRPEKDSPRCAPGGIPSRVLLRDDSGRMLVNDDGEQPRSDCGETPNTSNRLWGVGSRRILSRIGLGRNTGATSGMAGTNGFRDRASGSVVSSHNLQPPDGSAKTDTTTTIVTSTINNEGSASNPQRLASARAMSAETFMEGFSHARHNNTVSPCQPFAPVSSCDKRDFEFFKRDRGLNKISLSGGKVCATTGDGVESGKYRGRTTSNEGYHETMRAKDGCSPAAGASTMPSSSQTPTPAPFAFQRALSETSRGSNIAFLRSSPPLPV